MKIYFSAAIINKDVRGDVYTKIVSILENEGHSVLSYGVLDSNIDNILSQSDEDLTNHYKKVIKWINQSELVVVEASFPSTLHIGHEISLALEKNTPVVALYERNHEPFFLSGLNSDKLSLVEYSLSDLEKVLLQAIDYAAQQTDTRFNFFVAPKHQHYLDWIAKHKRVPRAVYLRKLIEKTMEEDAEYLAE